MVRKGEASEEEGREEEGREEEGREEKRTDRVLKHGAEVNLLLGLTAVYRCCIAGGKGNHIRCFQLLQKHGCQLGLRDHQGWTELHQVEPTPFLLLRSKTGGRADCCCLGGSLRT